MDIRIQRETYGHYETKWFHDIQYKLIRLIAMYICICLAHKLPHKAVGSNLNYISTFCLAACKIIKTITDVFGNATV